MKRSRLAVAAAAVIAATTLSAGSIGALGPPTSQQNACDGIWNAYQMSKIHRGGPNATTSNVDAMFVDAVKNCFFDGWRP